MVKKRVILGQVSPLETSGYAQVRKHILSSFLTNNRITLHVDNQVIVHPINNGVCKNDDIMESSHNVIADALSGLDFNIFLYFKPIPLLT